MQSRLRRRAFRALFLIAWTGAILAAAEAAARIIDGYRLLPLRLEQTPSASRRAEAARNSPAQRKWLGDVDAWPYVEALPVAAGVEREWFEDQLPGRPPWQADPDLAVRASRYREAGDLPANYEWNRNYVLGAICRGEPREDRELFEKYDDLFVFDPGDRSDTPRFRFLRHATYQSGLVTNNFGWRGPDVPLRKPANTIRLAFLGASTTVGMHAEPYSYPELVGIWLNRWARIHHHELTFEAINAGREGVNSHSIEAIVRQELQPLEPDLLFYYEGANQFWPADYATTTVMPRSRASVTVPGWWETHSALWRRLQNLLSATRPGGEPAKPPLRIKWPADVDEHDPDLSSQHVPFETRTVLADLEAIRRTLDESGGHLVVASFVWLVRDGLVLDPVRDALVFSYLNTTYWPFTYAHLRRFLDFQTTAFRKYASAHDLDFVDLASIYPSDPRLFGDAIHMTRAGIRLQAWIVFNGLVPIVERHLASGEWPRPARSRLSRHPAFGDRHRVPVSDLQAACGTGEAGAHSR